jgi:DNA/RNA endonuclease YhcR with UshA esterase domain
VRTIALFGLVLLVGSLPCQAYNVYYGNLHSHTAYSDGIGTPSQAYQYARDSAQVDILAITDHTHLLTTTEYNSLRSTAASYTQNGVFVAIAGQEHGSLSTTTAGSFGHMNFYEVSVLIPQYDNGGKDYRYNLTGTYNWLITHTDPITGHPLHGTFNHPYYTGGCGADAQFHHFAYSVAGDSAMSLIEIRNGKRADTYEPEYLEALAKGWHVGAEANQDNHEGMWGDAPNPNSGGDIYLTGVLANSLTKADILDALAARRTFAVEVNPKTDRMSVLFQCEGHWVGEAFTSAADTLHFSITVAAENDFITIQLLRNGAQIAYVSPGTNSYTWTPTDRPLAGSNYYFVRAQQTDGDYMWSSPIWVTSTAGGWTLISEVNADDANGEPLMLGQQVTIKGLATVATGTFTTADNDVFIQDGTGGVNAYKSATQSPAVAVGDSVNVTGYVDQYKGLTRIVSPTITVVTPGAGSTTPRLVTTNEIAAAGETYEGSLVVVRGCLIAGGTWPAAGVDGTITIDDGTGPCTMFIDKDTNIDGTPEPPSGIDVVGVLTQSDNTIPYFSGYRIMPRSTADITDGEGAGVAIPDGPAAFRVLPNPTRGDLRVVFGRVAAGPSQVAVYDVSGRLVDQLAVEPGSASVDWKARDHRGHPLPSGIYFVVVKSADSEETVKVVLVR